MTDPNFDPTISGEVPQQFYGDGMANPTNAADNVDVGNRHGVLSRFVEFTALKYAATIEWVGGVVGANAVHETAGTNRWLLFGITTLAISTLEYPQSRWAARRREKAVNDYSARGVKPGISNFPSEAGVFWSSTWQGAGATVMANESVGIDTTRTRSKFQSLSYGVGVGLWASPVPGYSHAAEKGSEVISSALDNPLRSSALGLAGSIAIFGLFEGIKYLRRKKSSDTEPVQQ